MREKRNHKLDEQTLMCTCGKTMEDHIERMLAKTKLCPNCSKPMKPVYDKIAKKVTGYLWSCECTPGVVISIG